MAHNNVLAPFLNKPSQKLFKSEEWTANVPQWKDSVQ